MSHSTKPVNTKNYAMYCHDCGGCDPYYNVYDHIWALAMPEYPTLKARKRREFPSINGKRDFRDYVGLCFTCLESRLGRPLTLEDFTNRPVNDGIRFGFQLGKDSVG